MASPALREPVRLLAIAAPRGAGGACRPLPPLHAARLVAARRASLRSKADRPDRRARFLQALMSHFSLVVLSLLV